MIEQDPNQKVMMIYPEGTQSNGQFLMPFKRGAFAGLNTVTPVVITYNSRDWLKVQWDVINFIELIILTFSSPQISDCFVDELPPFVPNDYLFEHHKDKGESKWEIYAWAVRDVMSKVSGKPKIEVDPRDKIIYKDFMTGKSDLLEKDGHRFELPPMRKQKKKKSEEAKSH